MWRSAWRSSCSSAAACWSAIAARPAPCFATPSPGLRSGSPSSRSTPIARAAAHGRTPRRRAPSRQRHGGGGKPWRSGRGQDQEAPRRPFHRQGRGQRHVDLHDRRYRRVDHRAPPRGCQEGRHRCEQAQLHRACAHRERPHNGGAGAPRKVAIGPLERGDVDALVAEPRR